MKKRTNNRITD